MALTPFRSIWRDPLSILRFSLPSLLAPVAFALLLTSPARAQSTDYLIGPKDVVRVKVFEAPEFDGELRVSDAGEVAHPIAGSVRIGGLTLAAATRAFTDLLESRYLQRGRATVSLEVAEFRARPVRVIGAVHKPGELEYSGAMTLIEALTAAGGVSSKHGGIAHVLRRTDNGLTDQIEVQLDRLLVHGDAGVNLPLFPNDLINVPETIEITVYCLGEVAQPGAQVFKSNERLTLLAAIASAGGVTDRAARKIVIKRRTSDGGEREIVVDYKQITSGRRDDVALERGDVVLVKQSFL